MRQGLICVRLSIFVFDDLCMQGAFSTLSRHGSLSLIHEIIRINQDNSPIGFVLCRHDLRESDLIETPLYVAIDSHKECVQCR